MPNSSPLRDEGFCRIGDYAMIGDCRAAALISRDGSLDWLCWPRFDSPAIFAGVLDASRGGHWRIRPADPARVSREYVRDSNVLKTTFEADGGTAVLTDLMPVASEETKRHSLLPDHEIIRQVECVSGEVRIEFEFHPRVGYGEQAVLLRNRGKLGIRMDVGCGVYWLRSSNPLQLLDCGTRAHSVIALRAGETLQYSLTYAEESPVVLPPVGEWTRQRIDATVLWWQKWAASAKYEGEYRELVIRSALTLKLLTYAPSGAIIAAPTTSLPERVGGPLNWDYRYCWLRDASLTTRALLGLGYEAEADAFTNWLLHATALSRPELRILYTVFGENSPRERELNSLSGYMNSKPVRIGNAARDQVQLDVYGEVIDGAAQYAHKGFRFDRSTQKVLIQLGNYVMKNWNRPDQGIWEPRSGPQNHTHSRLLCWVALDRLIKLEQRNAIHGAPIDEYKRERKRILQDIKQHSWNSRLGSYSSTLGGDQLDASLLLLSYYGFERADSERMKLTYAALREKLGAPHGLIYRYATGNGEGTFGVCSFWEVEYLALGGGTLAESRDLFEQVSSFRNDLGLFAEEIDSVTGNALGNFPQGFTHIGLISAALSISERARGECQLPHREDTAERNHASEVAA
jgi:GH15 family glucan-1,4-alpha-glucosidase